MDASSVINVRRLNTNLSHLPGPALRTDTNGICCQLCRWATGNKHASQLLKCTDCGFNLCAWCYGPFHTVPVLNLEFQERLGKEIVARNPKQPNKGGAIKKINKKSADTKAAKSKRKK